MDLGLSGKRAIVTGGSSGIGKAAALRFAAEGVRVLICARGEDRLRQAADDIAAATGVRPETAAVDVTSLSDLDGLRDVVENRLGGLDILVNNAGTGTYKPFLEVSDQELTDGMALNFFAQFRVSQRLVPMMIDGGGGAIVNVTGASGLMILDPPFYSTCTGPAKAAEHRFTKALAIELGPHNIRVNAVAPNLVEVPERLQRWAETMASEGSSVQDLQRQWAARVVLPGHRWATVEEVADTIAFAASPAAGYTTGTVQVLDGGFARS